jgi:DNA-binding LacI/PurR family transcriptional regulator
VKRSLTLGVLAPFLGGVYLGELVAQIHRSARASGMRVIAIRTGGLGAFDLPLSSAHVDAWIVVMQSVTSAHLAALADSGKPVAAISCRNTDPRILYIESDNEGATTGIVDKLIRAGHQHIAYIGHLSEYDIGRRLDGYRRAIAQHGLPYRPEYVVDTQDYGHVGGIRASQEIRARQLPVTAVVAGTDRNAIGAITYFRGIGLRIPEDIAVIGYD